MPLYNKDIAQTVEANKDKFNELAIALSKKGAGIQAKKHSAYKPVAGRKKLAEGKKARAENKGSTEFEMELVHYLDFIKGRYGLVGFHNFRSPASKTPVDVWSIESRDYVGNNISKVECYQCKTTKDTKPPKIIKKEFDEFVKFVNKINGDGYWVDRWKKNKNVYIRRIRGVHRNGSFHSIIMEDFSLWLKGAKEVN